MLDNARHKTRPKTEEDPRVPRIECSDGGGHFQCRLSGDWLTIRISAVDAEIRALEERGDVGRLDLDLSGIERMDTAGAWLIKRLAVAQQKHGAHVELVGVECKGAGATGRRGRGRE